MTSLTPMNPLKRKAPVVDNLRARRLRSASPITIKIEREAPRSASSPPDFSPLTVSRSELGEVAPLSDTIVHRIPLRAPQYLPPPPRDDDEASLQTEQAPQTSPTSIASDAQAQILQAFAQAGVPVATDPGSIGAQIAHAVATSFAGVVVFANAVQDHATAHAARLDAANARLETALRACNDERQRLEDEFARFRKRATQRDIVAQLRRVEADIERLRAPDVTLETMRAAVDGFELRLRAQDARIELFGAECEKELGRVATMRREFSKEAKAHKAGRRDDLKDLTRAVEDLQEKVDEKLLQEPASPDEVEIHEELYDAVSSNTSSIMTIEHELVVLRQHVAVLGQDDEQQKLNGMLSAGLQELKSKHWEIQQDIETKLWGAEARVDEKLALLQSEFAKVKEQFKEACRAFD